MNIQTRTFDYSTIDNSTASFLREKEFKVNESANRAFTEIGKELKEAQEVLSKNGYGCFIEWCESIGFKKDKAYALINRYELIVGNSDKQDLIESLPLSLSYEIAKKSVEPEIKKKVLDGEVTSLKELREVKKALQEAESRATHFEKLWNQSKNQQPKVVTQTVEKVPASVEAKLADLEFNLKQYKSGYEEAKSELEQYKLQDTDDFNEEQMEQQRKKLQYEADISTLQLSVHYKQFIEKAAITSYLIGALASSSPFEKKRLQELCEVAEKIIKETKLALTGRNLGGVINE